jgi:hypothetical protein
MTEFEIRKGVPIIRPNKRTGLTSTLRNMAYGDCIDVPGRLLSSIHPCASIAGIRVTTHKNDDGTVTVWRIDEPCKPKHVSIFSDEPTPENDLFS